MTSVPDAMRFQYLFDPLCGWCYASAPALAQLAAAAGDRLTMLPSGLFAAPRPMAQMADHAWANDRRIESVTGQRFTEAYHRQILLAPDGVFDSTAATRALVAIGAIDPALEAAFLLRVQLARYVEGLDSSAPAIAAQVAAAVAADAGVTIDAGALADRLVGDPALLSATAARIDTARRLMATLGLRGVPQLVVRIGPRHAVVSGEALYAGGPHLLQAIAALAA